MKTLYLLRHAKAEAASKVVSDPERTLSPRGVEACLHMGAYLKAKGYRPDFALSSPSARTQETLTRVVEAAGLNVPYRLERPLYLAVAEEILAEIQETDDEVACLLVVGHNPGMHHLALLLAEAQPGALRLQLELKYPTCALTALEFSGNHWKTITSGKGKLRDFVTPSDLE